ncbi:Leucine rich repeat protein [Leptospira santarosai]|nr:Leucine rich repeat protein [Leptospira santarosai]AVV78494.1 Leucine rich repeat protein [Leptospira santarosai]
MRMLPMEFNHLKNLSYFHSYPDPLTLFVTATKFYLLVG